MTHPAEIVPAASIPAAEAADRARLAIGTMAVNAQICTAGTAPVVNAWVTAGRFEVGDSDLDLEGVDALLADLPRFTRQLLALRDQLAQASTVADYTAA
jgi:hypothetical protein